jgi:hypothetical protein
LNTVIEVDQLAIERTTDASVLRTDIRNLKETCNQELSMIRNGRLMLALRRAIERGLKQKRVTSKEIQPLRKIIDRFEGREIDLALSYLNIAADTIAAPFFSLRLTSRNNVLDRAKSRAVSALGVSHRTDVHTTSEISLALHEARENYYSIAVERSLLGQLRRGGTINEIQTCFLTAGEDASFYNLARAVKMDLLLLGLRNSNLWEMYKPKDIRADSLLVLNYPSRFSQPQLGPSNFSLEIMGNIEDVAFSTRQVAMTCAAQLFGGSDIEEFFQNPAIILQDKSLSDKYHEQIANSGLSVFGAVRTVARERLEQAKLLSFIDIEIARNFLQYDPIPFSILDEVPEVAIGLLVKHLRSSDAMFQGLME